MKTLEEVLVKIANLNTDYEIEINSNLYIDGMRYTITIIETGHDYCVEKARTGECLTILGAAIDAWEQLTGEIKND